MAKTSHAIPEMDFTKMWAAFDPTKVMEQFTQFTKMTETPEMPKFDVDAIADAQRKNFAACAAAQRQAFDGAQAIARRQAEMLRDGFSEAQAILEAMTKAPSPRDAAIKQVEFAKDACGKFMAQSRELAEIATKSQTEAADLLAARVNETFDEFKKLAANGTAAAKKAAA